MSEAIDITNSDSTQAPRRVSGLPPRRRGNSVVAFPPRPVAPAPVSRGCRRNFNEPEAGYEEAGDAFYIPPRQTEIDIIPGQICGGDDLNARPDASVIVVPNKQAINKARKAMPNCVIVSPDDEANIEETDWSLLARREVFIWPGAGDANMEVGKRIWGCMTGLIERMNLAPEAFDRVQGITPRFDLPFGWTPGNALGELIPAVNYERELKNAKPCDEAFEPTVIYPKGRDYVVDEGGFARIKLQEQKDRNGRPMKPLEVREEISQSKLYVIGETADESLSETGTLLRFSGKMGEKDVVLFSRHLATPKALGDFMAKLTKLGFMWNPDAIKELQYYLLNVRSRNRITTASMPGWIEETAFILPTGEVFGTSKAPVYFAPSDEMKAEQPKARINFKKSGTLEGWQDKIALPSRYNSRLALGICAAFTGPLAAPFNIESGAFHIWGDSQTGKTIALIVASSVWGPKKRMKSWRATGNGLEGVAQAASNTLLCLDEIKEVSAREIIAIGYMLGGGVGKSRMRSDGSQQETKSWNVVVMSSGERTITDLAEAGGERVDAGIERRFVPIQADAGAGMNTLEWIPDAPEDPAKKKNASKLFANALKTATTKYYGMAGRAYLERLTEKLSTEEGRAEVEEKYTFYKNRFIERYVAVNPNFVQQVQSIGENRFAPVAAAGEIATWLGVLPWSDGDATRNIGKCFVDWIATKSGKGMKSYEDAAGITAVKAFLQKSSERNFANKNAAEAIYNEQSKADSTMDGRVSLSGEKYGYREPAPDGGTIFYVFVEAFRNVICKGHNHRKIAQKLAEMGALKKDSNGTGTTRHETIATEGRKRYYVINNSKFNDDDDDE